MTKDEIIQKLMDNEQVEIKITTNSLEPKIRAHQKITIVPVMGWQSVEDGDAVICKVNKSYIYGIVAKSNVARGVQINDGKNFVLGWTKYVYGKIV
jgi:hypothetical protein